MVTITIVAMIIKDLVLTTLFLIMYIGYLIIIFPYVVISELNNNESSSGRYRETKVYTIPISEEPSPSYESLFAMNTLPPPYHIAIKENWKRREDNLTIVSVE